MFGIEASLFFYPAILTHLLASSLFLLVATVLYSPNTENFVGKQFALFVIIAAGAELYLFFVRHPEVSFEQSNISNAAILIGISLCLHGLINSAEYKYFKIKFLSITSVLLAISLFIYCSAAIFPADNTLLRQFVSDSKLAAQIIQIIALLLALLISEQLYRNADPESKVICRPFFYAIWLWLIFLLYKICHLIVAGNNDLQAENISSSVLLLVAIICLIGSSRSTSKQRFGLSRDNIFYGTSLRIGSAALISIALLGLLVSKTSYNLAQALFLFFAAFSLAGTLILVIVSPLRAKLRVWINKYFFGNKYDYRNIWLTLIDRLSSEEKSKSFYETSYYALEEIFQAQGGILWIKKGDTDASIVVERNIEQLPEHLSYISAKEEFAKKMSSQKWVYMISGTNDQSATQHNHLLPKELRELKNAWIFGPLQIAGTLVGYFLLTRDKSQSNMIWEDLDIARSASSQIASYIIRQQSAEAIAETKQFDTYNQLTAFIMHDLKNLIAQQALVVKNANKHKDNPAFIEDMIRTVDNSVQRMTTLLARLKSKEESNNLRNSDLKQLLLNAIRKSTDRQPIPTLRNQEFELPIKTDAEQMIMILTHLIRNAQDATEKNGFVDIDVAISDNDSVTIVIEDNGSGMSEQFIKNRLFKPFESTKSSMGMGIGAFQAREFVRSMGGEILVESEVDSGTCVTITLPTAQQIP